MANATSTQLQELYVAYFGRAADPTGLDYWVEKGISQASFAADMYAQAEFKDAYGSKSVEAQVNQIYKNLFDREADVTGLTYWTQQINLGNLKVAEIATDLIWAAQNNSGSSDDKTALTNRTNAAIAYTAEVKLTTANILAYQPTTTDPWVAGTNITEGVNYLTGIDKDTAHTAAGITASVAKFTANSAVGSSLSLTTANDELTGGANDDTFSGQMDGTAALNTMGILDTVNGGAGTDTLIVVNTTANAASTQVTATNITNVETFDYRSTANGNLDFDTAGSATTFKISQTAGTSDLTDVNLADTVSFVNSSATMDTTMTYRATDVTGTADSDTIEINGVTAGADLQLAGNVETLTFTVTSAASFADLVLDAQTTAVNITADAALTITAVLTDAGVKDYTVTGAGVIDFDDAAAATLGAAVTTYDASAATGAQNIIVGATNTTVTTGSANDVVDMGANLNKNDTINLGAGTDTLRVDLDGLSAGVPDLTISGVETLRLDNTAGNNGAIQMDNLAIDTIRFDTGGARGGTITLTDIAATTTAFQMYGAGTADADPQVNAVTVDYDTTTTQSEATITINNGGAVADDILVGKFDIDRMEKLTITATEIGQAAADELTLDEIEGEHFTDLIVSADGEVIITNIDGAVVDTIDLSAADKGSTVTLTDSATAVTVTLGDGKDTFTQADTAGALTIDLGAGNDTVTGASAAIDNITTGTGNDDIISNDFDNEDVITDFTVGSDTFQIDLSVLETSNEAGTAIATFDLVDGNAATLTSGNFLTYEEVTATETIAAADQLLVLAGTDMTNGAVEIAIEATGAMAITTGTVLANDDAIMVLYSDGTDWTLAAAWNTTGAATGATLISAGEMEVTDLVTFSDLGSLNSGDYDATMFQLIA